MTNHSNMLSSLALLPTPDSNANLIMDNANLTRDCSEGQWQSKGCEHKVQEYIIIII